MGFKGTRLHSAPDRPKGQRGMRAEDSNLHFGLRPRLRQPAGTELQFDDLPCLPFAPQAS